MTEITAGGRSAAWRRSVGRGARLVRTCFYPLHFTYLHEQVRYDTDNRYKRANRPQTKAPTFENYCGAELVIDRIGSEVFHHQL